MLCVCTACAYIRLSPNWQKIKHLFIKKLAVRSSADAGRHLQTSRRELRAVNTINCAVHTVNCAVHTMCRRMFSMAAGIYKRAANLISCMPSCDRHPLITILDKPDRHCYILLLATKLYVCILFSTFLFY